MESTKTRIPMLKIPKLELCDFTGIEINDSTHVNSFAVNTDARSRSDVNKQVNTIDSIESDGESNATENRILFENYFCITSKERNSVTAVCNFCKDTKAFRGCMTNDVRFVKHLEVCNCKKNSIITVVETGHFLVHFYDVISIVWVFPIFLSICIACFLLNLLTFFDILHSFQCIPYFFKGISFHFHFFFLISHFILTFYEFVSGSFNCSSIILYSCRNSTRINTKNTKTNRKRAINRQIQPIQTVPKPQKCMPTPIAHPNQRIRMLIGHN